MYQPRKTPRTALTLLLISGCHAPDDEAESELPPVEGRGGSLDPQQPNNLRLMNVDADCDEDAEFDPITVYDMSLATRMQRLASMVIANSPDVVVIDEARSDKCRDALEDALSPLYPFYVEDIYYSNHGHTFLTNWDNRPSSGLMVFSKHPFEKFETDYRALFGHEIGLTEDEHGNPVEEVIDTPFWVVGSGFDETATYVAARSIYHDKNHLDAVAMVRVAPTSGGSFHVVLTGTGDWSDQATWTDDMLHYNAADVMAAPVFAIGELGVDGNDRSSWGEWSDAFDPAGHGSTPLMTCGSDGLTPGTSCRFDTERLFTEAWGFAQPASDLGQTRGIPGQSSASAPAILSDAGGTRQDYVLHSNPEADTPYLCPQRLRRVFFVDPDPSHQDFEPTTYESDQDGATLPFPDDRQVSRAFPIVADYLFSRTARCMAKERAEIGDATYGSESVDFTSSPVQNFPVTLGDAASGNRRHNAWFVLEDRATISIGALVEHDAHIEVYHHSDLSTPIPAWHGLETSWKSGDKSVTGPVFDLPDPPYFVRYEPSATAILPASFTATFHKHTCTNPDNDYCVVANNGDSIETSWPAGQQVVPFPANSGTPATVDALYFVAGVGLPDSKVDTRAVFTIESDDSSQFPKADHAMVFPHCGFDVALNDCGTGSCNTPTKDTVLRPWDASAFGSLATLDTANDVTGNLSPGTPGDVQPVLLRVHRSCTPATCAASSMKVSFDANFYQLAPVSLSCLDEEDSGSNDDEVYIQVATDGTAVHDAAACIAWTPGDAGGYDYLGRFDEHGDSNKAKTSFPGGWSGPWDLGAQTFAATTSVSLCESDVDSTSDNDFLGSAVHDIAVTPVPDGQTSEVFETMLTTADAAYRYRYRISADDPAWPPTCTP